MSNGEKEAEKIVAEVDGLGVLKFGTVGHMIACCAAEKAAAAQASTIVALKEQLADMETRKDAAYLERNQVVAALAKCFPSGKARTAIEGWSEDWHGCVYIDLPTGQASWHYHDSHARLFNSIPHYLGAWDGHTTEEKYARLAALASQPAAPVQPEAPTYDMFIAAEKAGVSFATQQKCWDAWFAAPPVQQPGDVREAWEYSFTHSSALGKGDTEVGPCLTYDRSTAYGVGCFGQRQVSVGQALATTRPSAALTEAQRQNAELVKARLQTICIISDDIDVVLAVKDAMPCINAILAASSGAMAVPEGFVSAVREMVDNDGGEGSRYDAGAFVKARSSVKAMISAAPAIPAQGQTK